jgi:hypothetical protein
MLTFCAPFQMVDLGLCRAIRAAERHASALVCFPVESHPHHVGRLSYFFCALHVSDTYMADCLSSYAEWNIWVCAASFAGSAPTWCGGGGIGSYAFAPPLFCRRSYPFVHQTVVTYRYLLHCTGSSCTLPSSQFIIIIAINVFVRCCWFHL